MRGGRDDTVTAALTGSVLLADGCQIVANGSESTSQLAADEALWSERKLAARSIRSIVSEILCAGGITAILEHSYGTTESTEDRGHSAGPVFG